MDSTKDPRRNPRRRRNPEKRAEKAAKPRRVRPEQNGPKVDRVTREPAPETVYTAPEPFNKRKFVLQILSVVAVAIALSFAMTIFFRVGSIATEDPKNPLPKIMVSGTEKYTPYMIAEASGIKAGDSLLSFGIARACGRITSTLPYVKDVRIGIKLPDTVNIEITEYDVAYAVKSQQGGWWLMTAAGKLLESVDTATAAKRGTITGFVLENPMVGTMARAAEELEEPAQEGEDGEPVATRPVTVTADQRLSVALTILQRFEHNTEIGKLASLDVTDIGSITLWYGEQYQVLLGNQDRLEYKVDCMSQAIAQMNNYQSGVLDVSFTIWQDEVGYTPFD